MKEIIWAAAIAILLSIAGCGLNTSRTTASYVTPDGKQINYDSDKEHTGLDAIYELYPDGKVKSVHIKVDKAGTSELAIQAGMARDILTSKLIEALIPILQKGAMGGS